MVDCDGRDAPPNTPEEGPIARAADSAAASLPGLPQRRRAALPGPHAATRWLTEAEI